MVEYLGTVPATLEPHAMNRRATLAAFALLASFAINVQAAPAAGMSEADMKRMMQAMQAMQACMARVDMAAMERLGEEGRQVEKEVQALCRDGKRDAAQSRAMAFGIKAAKDPAMQQMGACSEQAQGMMPPMPYAGMGENDSRHICDM
jgi:hypothetical protein